MAVTTPAAIADLTAEIAPAVAQVAVRTPLELVEYLSTPRKRVFVKREDLQTTGSFKIRGATAKIATLDAEELGAGVVAASTGNHGLAVSHAAALRGTAAIVYVPADASRSKIERIERSGGEVRIVPGNAIEAEHVARREAETTARVYISPYNDPAVVAGQGTIGLELREQLPGAFTLIVAVGGGGLVAGAAASLRQRKVTVVGTSPSVDAAMAASVAAGVIVDVDGAPTLSDGTAGNLEHDTITLELCRVLVDQWVLQPEEAIAAAGNRHREATGVSVEGSAAMALATADALDATGDVVAIICGGNV